MTVDDLKVANAILKEIEHMKHVRDTFWEADGFNVEPIGINWLTAQSLSLKLSKDETWFEEIGFQLNKIINKRIASLRDKILEIGIELADDEEAVR